MITTTQRPRQRVSESELPPGRISECNVEQFLYWCEVAIRRGAPPPAWVTREQYMAALSHYPNRFRLVSPEEHQEMGLPRNFGRVTPLSIEWQERFLSTLQSDDDFRAAVSGLIGGVA